MEGVHRFLARSYRLVTGGSVTEAEPSNDQLRSLHIAIKRVCLSCLSNRRGNLCFIRLVLTLLGPSPVDSCVMLAALWKACPLTPCC